jgi:tetratricopeptide (TPR) repeat protein
LGIDEQRNGVHAGLSETSMVLAVRPDLVHMDRAEQGYLGDSTSAAKKMKEEGTGAVSVNGVIGDPRGATAKLGREYLNDLSSYLVGFVREQNGGWQPLIPTNLRTITPSDPKGPLAEGIRYRRAGDYDKASSFFAKRLEADPKDTAAALELAKTYMLNDQFAKASEVLSPLVGDPNEDIRYQSLDKLGEVDLVQGKFHAAIKHKDEARQLRVKAGDPIGEARKLMWIAYIETQVGLYDDAEAALKAGLKITPSVNDLRPGGLDETAASGISSRAGGASDTFLDLQELLVGLEIKRNHLLKATEYLRPLEDAVIQPEFAAHIRQYYRMQGSVLLARGRVGDAIVNLSIAAKMIDYPEYEIQLGRAYMQADRLPEAEAPFKKLIDLRGDSRLHTPDQYVMAYYFLGRTYEKMGRKADAEAMYRKFLSFWGQADIELPEIAEAKARLAN